MPDTYRRLCYGCFEFWPTASIQLKPKEKFEYESVDDFGAKILIACPYCIGD